MNLKRGLWYLSYIRNYGRLDNIAWAFRTKRSTFHDGVMAVYTQFLAYTDILHYWGDDELIVRGLTSERNRDYDGVGKNYRDHGTQ